MRDKNDCVAARIKELRFSKGLSQCALAKSLNVAVTTYNRVENGRTQLTINMLFSIADALDIPVSSLLNVSFKNVTSNKNNDVTTDFYNGSLHVTISVETLKKHLLVR